MHRVQTDSRRHPECGQSLKEGEMLVDCLSKRYSCRAYQDLPVEEQKVNNLIEAVRLAPSARNNQSWKLVLIQSKQKLEGLKSVCKQEFPSQAPLVIAVCCTNLDKTMSCGHPAYLADGFGATMSLLVQATAEGLGSCWLGAFRQQEAAKLINLPSDYKVVSLVTIGYPSDNFVKKDRKNPEEITIYDSF